MFSSPPPSPSPNRRGGEKPIIPKVYPSPFCLPDRNASAGRERGWGEELTLNTRAAHSVRVVLS